MRIILSILYAPIVFFSLRYFDTPLEEALVLKAFPLILSTSITILIYVSYLQKKSMILFFAQKFSKKEIDNKEKEYIHKSTLFWVGISIINVSIHGMIFFDKDENFWIFYSSIGWYFLFILAGFLQFLHRKYIFLNKDNNES